MKLCNFRPLCFLALIVIIGIASSLISLWLTLVVGVALLVVLHFVKVPKPFKIAAVVVFGLAIASFVLTTAFNPHPYYRTYNPNAGLRGVILRYVDHYLQLFLTAENADLLYSLMFGDKSGLPFVLRNNFTVSGLAHMLAVSGMHVALLAGVVVWLLKICRVSSKVRLWVITPLLIFYAYLCGWQYAILRAVIMFLVYLFAKNHLHIADPLSTLSLAAVIILLLFPYSLVSASFLLSFSCLLGINFLYRFFLNCVYLKSIAVYFSVTIATFPFVVYFFGYVPLYGILANVVLVPLLLAAFYVGMFAVTTYALGAVLWLIDPLLTFVRHASATIAALPYATVTVTSDYPAIIVYLLGLIVLSRFVFLKPKVRYPLAVMLFACYFILIVF